jgi:HicA toxin of bacterial toxin-antitoxin,
MSKHEKVLQRLLSKPTDFTWTEFKSLMETFQYELKKTGGSGRKFIHSPSGATLFMHEPHPSKVLKAYQVREAIRFLKQEGHIQ